MAAVKYSVSEIDQMRASLRSITRGDDRGCEDQLRTYMLNGTEPYELLQLEAEDINRRVDEIRRRIQRQRSIAPSSVIGE